MWQDLYLVTYHTEGGERLMNWECVHIYLDALQFNVYIIPSLPDGSIFLLFWHSQHSGLRYITAHIFLASHLTLLGITVFYQKGKITKMQHMHSSVPNIWVTS